MVDLLHSFRTNVSEEALWTRACKRMSASLPHWHTRTKPNISNEFFFVSHSVGANCLVFIFVSNGFVGSILLSKSERTWVFAFQVVHFLDLSFALIFSYSISPSECVVLSFSVALASRLIHASKLALAPSPAFVHSFRILFTYCNKKIRIFTWIFRSVRFSVYRTILALIYTHTHRQWFLLPP